MPEMLSEQEAAPLLGVKPQTLRKWRCRPPRDGGPPYYRVGRLVRYDPAELEKWKWKRRVGK